MLIYLYLMTAVTLYSLVDDMMHFILYSHTCHPTRISPSWDSFFIMLHWILSDQVWMYPIIIFFWPSRATKKRESSYERGKVAWDSFNSYISTRTTDHSSSRINEESKNYSSAESSLELNSPTFRSSIDMMKNDAAYLSFEPRTSREIEEKTTLLLE